MDIADRAQSEAEQLSNIINKGKPVKISERLSAFYCENCGDPIPEQRRKAVAGCTLCVDCQAEREARR